MLLSSYSLSIESPGNSWYAVNDIIPTLLRILDGKTIYTLYFHPYNLAMLNNEYDSILLCRLLYVIDLVIKYIVVSFDSHLAIKYIVVTSLYV